MAKKGSQLTVRTATEIQGGEFVILGYAGRSYQMTLDELKKFIGIIEADGGSVDLTQVSTDILPLADASKDIGSLEKRWKKVYSTALTVKAQSVDEEEVNIHDGGIEGILGRDIQWSIDGSGKANFYELTINGADVATMDYVNNELSKYVTTDTLTKNYVSNTSLTEILKKYPELGYVEFLLSSKASTGDLNKTNAQLGIVQTDVATLKSYFQDTDDVDDIINKWRELEAFLAGQTETSTLAELLSVKADKETVTAINSRVTDLEDADFVDIDSLRSTLGGYYTKEEVDDLLGEAGGVDLTGYVNEIAASGTGNGIASVSKDGSKLTFTMANFLTSHQSLDGYINSVGIEGIDAAEGGVVTGYRKSGKSLVLQRGLSVYSKEEVNELIGGISIPSLDGYVTTDALTDSLNNLAHTYLSFRGGGTVSGATTFSGGLSVQNSLMLLGVEVAAGSSGLTFGGKIPLYSGSTLASANLDKNTISIAGTSVSLGGSITQNQLIANLGLKGLAFKDSIDLSGYQPLITSTNKLAYSLISGTPTLAAVATSGSYNDLSNKPTIPDVSDYVKDGGSVNSLGITSINTTTIRTQGDYIRQSGSSEVWKLSTHGSGNNPIFSKPLYVQDGNSYNLLATQSWANSNFQPIGTYLTSSDLNGYATQSWVEGKDYLSKYGDAANSLKLGGVNASDYALKADYLPLSGGTISGVGADILTINRTDGENSVIQFNNNGTFLGRLGYKLDGTLVAQVSGNYQSIIHAGNIGSQTVAAANKLVTSGGTNAVLINSSGNVTIGSSDLAGTSAKLYVAGRVYTDIAFLFNSDVGIWKGRQYTGALTNTDIVYNAINHVFYGNVGIGTTNPNTKLHVVGGAKITSGLTVGSATDYIAYDGSSLTGYKSSASAWSIDPSGNGSFASLNVDGNAVIHAGNISSQSVQSAYTAQNATIADKATNDSAGNKIVDTYLKKSDYNDSIEGLATESWVSQQGYAVASLMGVLNITNAAGNTATFKPYNNGPTSLTINKSFVGLSNVENTALSTWDGSDNITTLGTITIGTWNGSKITNAYLEKNTIIVAGQEIPLGGEAPAENLKGPLGITALSSTVANHGTIINDLDIRFSGYLPLSGGTISGVGADILTINRTDGENSVIQFNNNGTFLGRLGYNLNGTPIVQVNGAYQSLIHSGNISSQSVASANKLSTSRTIWGQSFDGSYGISGEMAGVSTIRGNTDVGAPYIVSSGNPTQAGSLGHCVGIGSAPQNYGIFFWGEGSGNGHIQVGRKDGGNTAYNLCLQELGGNVGIGTNNPNTKLHVVGGAKIEGALSTVGGGLTIDTSNSDIAITHYKGTTKLWTMGNYNGCANFSDALYVQSGSTPVRVATVSDLSSYLPKAGGTIIGSLTFSSTSVSHIIGNSNSEIIFQPSNNTSGANIPLKIAKTGSSTYTMYCDESEVYDLGTSSYKWNILYCRSASQSSDATLKNILGNVELTTSQIANAPAVNFTWKNGGTKDVGTIAQYWKNVLPEVVSGEEGSYGMNYAVLGVVSSIILARNIETHEQRIARLEKEKMEMKAEAVALKAEIVALKAAIANLKQSA